VLRAALEDLVGGLESFTLGHIDAVVDLVHREEGTAQVDLPRGVLARREYGDLVITGSPDHRDPPPVPEASPPLDLEHPGELRWGRVHLKWSPARAEDLGDEALAGAPDRGFFDLEVAVPPVYLRSVRPGDRLEPLGMEGTQKLSDLFINRKVPRQLRTWVPLLCDNGGSEDGERILWVVGQRRSRHAPVAPETSQVVLFEAETIL
jgi:tRNA(Ile)-lysidine synthase